MGDSCKMAVKIKVEHKYHDFANLSEADIASLTAGSKTGSNQSANFPAKLHYMLSEIETDGNASVVGWQRHGRCFVVHDQTRFVEDVLPQWFQQSRLSSFQRQLNIYGFKRITAGRDRGSYYHELFLRSKPTLAHFIKRTKVKGTGARKSASPETEPDFYAMSYLPTGTSTGMGASSGNLDSATQSIIPATLKMQVLGQARDSSYAPQSVRSTHCGVETSAVGGSVTQASSAQSAVICTKPPAQLPPESIISAPVSLNCPNTVLAALAVSLAQSMNAAPQPAIAAVEPVGSVEPLLQGAPTMIQSGTTAAGAQPPTNWNAMLAQLAALRSGVGANMQPGPAPFPSLGGSAASVASALILNRQADPCSNFGSTSSDDQAQAPPS